MARFSSYHRSLLLLHEPHLGLTPNTYATHSHDMGILATDIPDCTIMFCSFAESAHDQGKPAARLRRYMLPGVESWPPSRQRCGLWSSAQALAAHAL